MSTQYAVGIPFDRNGTPLQEFPAAKAALATTANENASASSVVTLTDNTTVLEITAVGGSGAVMKWGSASVISAAGTANFDHFIPAGRYRRFVVPMNTQGVSSIVGLNKQSGLFNTVAVKAAGIASVLTTEY